MSGRKKPTADGDPRFAALCDALARDPRLAPVVAEHAARRADGHGSATRHRFGVNGLTVNGKIFAMMSSRGAFVVKLPRARVEALIADGRGTRFDPGHGRLMAEWLVVGDPPAVWPDLAREAHDYVSVASGARRTRGPR